MITRALSFRRSESRRPRPSRFPTPGFPRGLAAPCRRAAFLSARSSSAYPSLRLGYPARATPGGGIGRGGYPRPKGVGAPPSEIRHVKTSTAGADLFTAVAMVGGIVLWGGLLVLLAG